MSLPRYRFSGAVPALGLAQGVVAGTVVAVILGSIYGWLAAVALPGLMQASLAAALGAVVGYFTVMPMVLGNVRNPRVVTVTCTTVASIAHVCGWLLWISTELVNRGASVSLGLFTPSGALAMLSELNRRGTWALGAWASDPGRMTTGWLLAASWVAETVIVLGCAGWVGYRLSSSTPFCEPCGRWCWLRRGAVFRNGAPASVHNLLKSPPSDWVERLQALPPARTTDTNWLQVDLHECRRCGRPLALTVRLLTHALSPLVLWSRVSVRHGLLPAAAMAALKTGRRRHPSHSP